MFLKISQSSHESTCSKVSFKRETVAPVFSYDFCQIFKITFSLQNTSRRLLLSFIVFSCFRLLNAVFIDVETVFLEVFCKKVLLKISQNSEENTCARVPFLKKRLRHRSFPVNFAKFLRTSIFIKHLGWLLLSMEDYLRY